MPLYKKNSQNNFAPFNWEFEYPIIYSSDSKIYKLNDKMWCFRSQDDRI